MPVRIERFPAHSLRWVRYWGDVSTADLGHAVGDSYDRKRDTERYSFLDLRDIASLSIDSNALMAASNAMKERFVPERAMLRLACHAEIDTALGLARLYTAFLNNTGAAIAMVSTDRNAALEWLGLRDIPEELVDPPRL